MSHVPAERCLSIIQLLAENAAELPLGEIAEQLDLPKSGAHRLLATLVDEGWAKKDSQTGFYQLTMRLAILGQRFYVATGIPDICQPLLDQLAASSREFVRLAVVDTDSLVWVAHAQGAKGGLLYQPSLTTATVPLHATASGKAWLSTLPVDTAVEIVLRSGGFESADAYGPERRAIRQQSDRGTRGDGQARLWRRDERSRARRIGSRGGNTVGRRRSRRRHCQHCGTQRPYDG